MKKLGFLLTGVLALLFFVACSNEEDDVNKGGEEYDDAYWAAQATVTSSDPGFTATDNGGTINFRTEGGQVALTVDCGCGWIAENGATDLFAISTTGTTLTVTAGQNMVEKELEGTITLRTENQLIIFATITATQNAYGAPEITVSTNEWHAPAVGALTTEIAVEASEEWTAGTANEWLTVVKTAMGITITAEENVNTTEGRSGRVTITCTDGVSIASKNITVSQDGMVYISFGGDYLKLGYAEGSGSIAVESNFDWDFSYDGSNGWFTVSRNGDTLVATATANTTDSEREGVVIVTAGDGAANVTEEVLTVRQSMLHDEDMVLTYTIAYANTVVRLPLYGTVNCTVNWGDGTEETVTSVRPSHTYAERGEYDVTISGTVTALSHSGIASSSNPQTSLIAVKQWGDTGLTDMTNAFLCCENLESLPESSGYAFSKVTSFYCAFYCCSSLGVIPKGLFDNCSSVTSLQATFYNNVSLTEIPEGLFDACTRTTTFSATFQGCSSIAGIPKGLFDKCTSATSLYSVFNGCSSITEIPEGLFDKCTRVTDFGYAFYGLHKITALPDGLFDNCPSVTSFKATFYNCYSITKIPDGLFDKCTNVTDFSFVFSYCTVLESIPKGLFDNCPLVTTFHAAFQECDYLEAIPEGLFDYCTKVTDFSFTFSVNESLKSIPAELFYNCPDVTTFSHVFQTCASVTEVPPGLFDKNLKVTDFSRTFCNFIRVAGESPYTLLSDGTKVHLYERAAYTSQMGCVAPTEYTECFYYSTFSDLDSIPSSWKGGNSTNSISTLSTLYTETSPVDGEVLRMVETPL